MGDRWGFKPILLTGLVLLDLSNLPAAFATSATTLIGPWVFALPVALAVVSFLATAAFVVVGRRTPPPAARRSRLRIRGLASGSLNLVVVFAVMFSLFLVLVQDLQAVLGYTALAASARGGCLRVATAFTSIRGPKTAARPSHGSTPTSRRSRTRCSCPPGGGSPSDP